MNYYFFKYIHNYFTSYLQSTIDTMIKIISIVNKFNIAINFLNVCDIVNKVLYLSMEIVGFYAYIYSLFRIY